jgi:DNA-binding CsgD family transcriptional regulator
VVDMTETVSNADLRGLLDVVDATRSGAASEGLPVAALEQLKRLVPCDGVSFTELDTRRREVLLDQSLGAADDEDGEDDGDAFWRHYWDCLACSYPDRSGDEHSITTISDFYSRREFHATGMYAEYLGRFMEHEAMMCLAGHDGRSRRVIFFRGRGADFDGRDRLLLALLRPHLVEAYREIELRRRTGPQLTPRQRELLALVARGYSNVQIARALAISPGTVRKHLENIFERLSVTSRTAAVAMVSSTFAR